MHQPDDKLEKDLYIAYQSFLYSLKPKNKEVNEMETSNHFEKIATIVYDNIMTNEEYYNSIETHDGSDLNYEVRKDIEKAIIYLLKNKNLIHI